MVMNGFQATKAPSFRIAMVFSSVLEHHRWEKFIFANRETEQELEHMETGYR